MKVLLKPLVLVSTIFILFFACPNLLKASEGQAEKWFGLILEIVDGDTVKIKRLDTNRIEMVRLYGIDAPEFASKNWKSQAYCSSAKKFTQKKAQGKHVSVTDFGIDKYNRILGVVELKNREILQEALLSEGLAWVYEKYCDKLVCNNFRELQKKAQGEQKKIWSQKDSVAPWVWRKGMVDE